MAPSTGYPFMKKSYEILKVMKLLKSKNGKTKKGKTQTIK